MELTKQYDIIPAAVQQKLAEADWPDLRVGDIFINTREPQTLIRITKISVDNRVKEPEPRIHYDHNLDYACTEWSSYGSELISNFNSRDRYVKLEKPLHEYIKDAADYLTMHQNTFLENVAPHISVYSVGAKRYYKVADLDLFLEKNVLIKKPLREQELTNKF